MPAVSGSPTQEATTQPSVAALESVEVASMGDGDIALNQFNDVYYVLDVESVAVRDGFNVLYTRNSNPLYTPSATAATPSRWLLFITTPGATGVTGAPGPGLLSTFGNFYSLTPPTTTVIAQGSAMDFPIDGPASSITRMSATQFVLPAIGIYEVNFQSSVNAAGQLVIGMDATTGATELPFTLVGRDTGTSQIVGNTLITTTVANSVLTIRNPAASATTVVRDPSAGGPSAASSTLTIKRIA